MFTTKLLVKVPDKRSLSETSGSHGSEDVDVVIQP
jgi:hypothetical protein